MKEQLISVLALDRTGNALKLELCANTDNARPIIIRENGKQIGKNYKSFAAAAKRLEQILYTFSRFDFEKVYTKRGGPADIRIDGGSEMGKALYRWEYCGEPFPDPAQYYPGWSVSNRKG